MNTSHKNKSTLHALFFAFCFSAYSSIFAWDRWDVILGTTGGALLAVLATNANTIRKMLKGDYAELLAKRRLSKPVNRHLTTNDTPASSSTPSSSEQKRKADQKDNAEQIQLIGQQIQIALNPMRQEIEQLKTSFAQATLAIAPEKVNQIVKETIDKQQKELHAVIESVVAQANTNNVAILTQVINTTIQGHIDTISRTFNPDQNPQLQQQLSSMRQNLDGKLKALEERTNNFVTREQLQQSQTGQDEKWRSEFKAFKEEVNKEAKASEEAITKGINGLGSELNAIRTTQQTQATQIQTLSERTAKVEGAMTFFESIKEFYGPVAMRHRSHAADSKESKEDGEGLDALKAQVDDHERRISLLEQITKGLKSPAGISNISSFTARSRSNSQPSIHTCGANCTRSQCLLARAQGIIRTNPSRKSLEKEVNAMLERRRKQQDWNHTTDSYILYALNEELNYRNRVRPLSPISNSPKKSISSSSSNSSSTAKSDSNRNAENSGANNSETIRYRTLNAGSLLNGDLVTWQRPRSGTDGRRSKPTSSSSSLAARSTSSISNQNAQNSNGCASNSQRNTFNVPKSTSSSNNLDATLAEVERTTEVFTNLALNPKPSSYI